MENQKQYKVISAEDKVTAQGKAYKVMSLGEAGTTERHDRVSIWGDSPVYSKVIVDEYITGEVVTNEKGYKNFRVPQAPRQGGGGSGMIAKAQERKSEGIEKAQDRKETGIKLSACNRDATLILTSLIQGGREGDWKANWIEIRQWLFDNYEMKEGEDIVLEALPF